MTSTLEPALDTRAPNRTRISLAALFAVYLVLLAWIVLWKLDVPWVGGVDRVIKLVPFVSSATNGPSEPFEVVVNLLLFVPFGLFAGLLAPRWPWWRVAGAAIGASLVLETAQFVLAVGSTDVTDLIVNTAGALIGFGVLTLARRANPARADTMMARTTTIVTLLAVFACLLFIASPVQLGGPPPSGAPGLSTPTTH